MVGDKKTFQRSEQMTTLCKIFFSPRQFYTLISKSFQIWDHFFQLLFPKDSKYLKSLDIGLWKVGPKRPLNGVRKCDGQTHKQTHKHTDISTYKKHRPRGPMLWKWLKYMDALSLCSRWHSVKWTVLKLTYSLHCAGQPTSVYSRSCEKIQLYAVIAMQTWNKLFFVNSENLGIRIWPKKLVNYNTIQIAARLCKSNI